MAQSGWASTTRFDAAGVAVIYDHHPAEVGAAAFRQGLQLYELSPAGTSLEALFFQLTSTSAQPAVAP